MTDQDSSQRPYLVRAMHEWMTDAGKTPHLVIDASVPGVQIPAEHVKDGKIVLNSSYSATKNLVIGNDVVELEARFGGRPYQISAPIDAVLGIYARETGEGMLFTDQEDGGNEAVLPDSNDDDGPEPSPAGPGRSHLRIVK
jgi:stringent starvation protein B